MTNHFKIFAIMADYEAYIAGEHATPLVAYISATGKCILPEGSGGGGNQLLRSIDIDDFTGPIMRDARYYLTEATIPNGVTDIDNFAFFSCALTSVTIPNTVTTIGMNAFEGNSFTSLTIPESVTTIGDYAFSTCTKLTSITIPDSVTAIGIETFYNCNKLTSVTIGSSVTTIDNGAFKDCTSLPSVDIPDAVTTIGGSAFDGCRSLASATIGNSVTSIGEKAFYNCRALTSVTVRATTPPTLGGNAFVNTHADLVIYVPAASVDAYKAASGWSTYANQIQEISE